MWGVLPVLIALSRVFDVSLGTLRVVFVARGMKLLAPVLGFFEVLIWLVAISQIMSHLTTPLYYVAYAAGFSLGTYTGMFIESKLAIGVVSLRIITQADASELIQSLHHSGFGVTSMDASGAIGPVHIIYTLLTRHDLKKAIALVKTHNPNAFYMVEDIRFVREGVFPKRQSLAIPEIHFHLRHRVAKKK